MPRCEETLVMFDRTLRPLPRPQGPWLLRPRGASIIHQ